MAQVLIETSARHVHLSKEHIDILFGAGHELTFKKALSQPGQFACEERVTVVGEKKEIKNISILGPARSATQVEVSLTDARTLGVKAPVRESGDIAGSGACKIIGRSSCRNGRQGQADRLRQNRFRRQKDDFRRCSHPRQRQVLAGYAHRYRRIQRSRLRTGHDGRSHHRLLQISPKKRIIFHFI